MIQQMKEKIIQLKTEAETAISEAKDSRSLDAVKIRFFWVNRVK